MSILFASASNQWLNVLQGFNYNAVYSVGGWLKFTTITNPQNIAGIYFDVDNMDFLSFSPLSGNVLVVNQVGGSVPGSAGDGSAMSASTWYYIAMVRTSTTSLLSYMGTTPSNIVLQSSLVCNTSGRTSASAEFSLGAVFGGFSTLDGALFGWKAATRVWSLDEIKAEAAKIRPVTLISNWGAWPLLQATVAPDITGNNRGLTVNGSPTTTDNPAIPYGNGTLASFGTTDLSFKLNDQNDSTFYTSPNASLSSTLYVDMPIANPQAGPVTIYLRLRRDP